MTLKTKMSSEQSSIGVPAGAFFVSAALTAVASGLMQNWWSVGLACLAGFASAVFWGVGRKEWSYMALSVVFVTIMLLNLWLVSDSLQSEESMLTSSILSGSLVVSAFAGIVLAAGQGNGRSEKDKTA